jgi:hypothetical protein
MEENPHRLISGRRLQVVVSCSKRKLDAAPRELQLHTLPGASLASRCHRWTQRLTESSHPRFRADDLYQGAHWQTARRLPEVARKAGLELKLWIASAGYGLVPHYARLKPYAATFEALATDGVVTEREIGRARSLQSWWAGLGAWEGPTRAERTLEQLAKHEPADKLVIALGADYLLAVESDLRLARAAMRDPQDLLVISAGTRSAAGLDGNLLPVDASLLRQVGGSCHTLNVRVVEWLLTRVADHNFELPRAASLLKAAGSISTVARSRGEMATDVEVHDYVRNELRRDSSLSASAMLAAFRASGRACEQGRFRRLFSDSVSRP